MRMFRLPSWISEPRGNDKVNGEQILLPKDKARTSSMGCDKAELGQTMHDSMCAPDSMNTSFEEGNYMEDMPLNSLSQTHLSSDNKRPWNADVDEEPHAKRFKSNSLADSAVDMASVLSPAQTPDLTSKESVSPDSEVNEKAHVAPADMERKREIFDSQLSLEILFKHNELRLINQELAKCQIAMEQLRRCHLIPYPTSQPTPDSMVNISTGTGPAVGCKGEQISQWAPPYGVTDGPYARHLAKWLIPDPKFGDREWLSASRASKTTSEGRSTRHSNANQSAYASTTPRARNPSHSHQQLSSAYVMPKERGPCVLTRSDGRTVKLVCIDCQREDFASIQGFINHCRISHQREFRSHEQAAMASGQTIEKDEVSGAVAEERTPSTATGLVHPFIPAAPPTRETHAALLSHINASVRLYRLGRLPLGKLPSSIPEGQPSPAEIAAAKIVKTTSIRSFVPSHEAPHLSNLMKKKGFNGNLAEMVGKAKEKLENDEMSPVDDEDDEDSAPVPSALSGMDGASGHASIRMGRASILPVSTARPMSSKGLDARKPGVSPHAVYASPIIDTAAANVRDDFGQHHAADRDVRMMNLSPNTITSNNAPSLVSDDDDDEADDVDSSSEAGEEPTDATDIDEITIETGDLEVPRRTSSGCMRKEDAVTFVKSVKEERHSTVL